MKQKRFRRELLYFLSRAFSWHHKRLLTLEAEAQARDDAFNDLLRRVELLERITLE